MRRVNHLRRVPDARHATLDTCHTAYNAHVPYSIQRAPLEQHAAYRCINTTRLAHWQPRPGRAGYNVGHGRATFGCCVRATLILNRDVSSASRTLPLHRRWVGLKFGRKRSAAALGAAAHWTGMPYPSRSLASDAQRSYRTADRARASAAAAEQPATIRYVTFHSAPRPMELLRFDVHEVHREPARSA
jgi:hypothetical protein